MLVCLIWIAENAGEYSIPFFIHICYYFRFRTEANNYMYILLGDNKYFREVNNIICNAGLGSIVITIVRLWFFNDYFVIVIIIVIIVLEIL